MLSIIPHEEKANTLQDRDIDVDFLPMERALGVDWDSETDEFIVHVKCNDSVYTKHGLLSTMSSIYDPLGLVGPYVLCAKRIFQDKCMF